MLYDVSRQKAKKVKDILDDTERQKLINLDEGYYIFRTIRNSLAYLEKRKKDAFAMFRQLGCPSLFMSQSCAETKWPELLRALGQLVDNKTYTDQEIESMGWQTKCRLIKADSPEYGHDYYETVANYYDQIISCSSDVPQEHKQYIEYQVHRHSKTCCVGNTHKCRFSFPVPPMSSTVILEPIECQSTGRN